MDTINSFLSVVTSRLTSHLPSADDTAHANYHQHHRVGFWGIPSSTVDWCELNYDWTYYIAEFFNTLSSFAMIVVGLIGLVYHMKQFERRFHWAFGSVAIVGLGSTAFHATLKFSLQMLDELPMVYSGLIIAYIMIEQPYLKPKYGRWLPTVMILHAIITTLLVASPAFFPNYSSPLLQFICFHISFAALEIFSLVKIGLMYKRETNPHIRKLFVRGVSLWCSAVGFWLLDYIGCNALWEGHGSLRNQFALSMSVPDLWSFHQNGQMTWHPVHFHLPNPQFHSWWHICASIGLYLMAVVVAYDRTKVLKQRVKVDHILGILPYIVILGDEKNERVTKKKKENMSVLMDSERPSVIRTRAKKSSQR